MADEQIGKPEETTDTASLKETPGAYAEMSNSQLQDELVKLGMPEDEARAIKTSKVLISIINTLKASKAAGKVEPAVTAAVDPKEDKKTEKNWVSKAHKQWGFWLASPKVKIIVPLNGKEKQGVIRWVTDARMKLQVPVHVSGAVQSVIENGALYLIPKGVYAEVPEPVARIIEAKFKQTSDAGKDILADRIDPETGRPVSDQL